MPADLYTELTPTTEDAIAPLVARVTHQIIESGVYHEQHNFGHTFASRVEDVLEHLGFVKQEWPPKFGDREVHMTGSTAAGRRIWVHITTGYLFGHYTIVRTEPL